MMRSQVFNWYALLNLQSLCLCDVFSAVTCYSLNFLLQDLKKFETEVKALQTALEQAQATLTSSEIGRLSLKEQLSHRQVDSFHLEDTIWTRIRN